MNDFLIDWFRYLQL
ncbi:hypothetical protein Patl1_19438 [Pistacia atlantica]|uniref:Uncharacterized protein n=1 Tax=Pistacia atlantica TaxID=434234 RepID=A0ACC1BYC3_9ROSI|nr:hypothetical protein Patl1_19438 [Pistacia atlantica]